MMRLGATAAALALALALAAPARADTHPTAWLSRGRLGLCAKALNTTSAVDCWLTRHPTAAQAMWYRDASFFGPWAAWPQPLKDQFHDYFNAMVLFYHQGMPGHFPQPIANPLPLHGPPLLSYNGSHLSEADGRTAYLLLLGNNLAAELTTAFPWSIATYDAQQASLLLSMADVIGVWEGPPQVAEAGYYFVGNVTGSPATPVYTLRFFKNEHLFGADALETVVRLVAWERKLDHFFVDSGIALQDVYPLFWGPLAPPVSARQIVDGTTYTGPSGPWFGHWTLGCHGTMDFMKNVLQAVNIPVKQWNTASHATPVFPTIGRALTHGDDPYSALAIVTPVPGFPAPLPEEMLAGSYEVEHLCDPNWTDPTWCSHKVGILPAMIAVVYTSDYLMKLHCQDLAAGHTHATSNVLNTLVFYFPEKTSADVQSLLETVGLWTRLDAKVAATGFCQ
jgi:hypothetical protein